MIELGPVAPRLTYDQAWLYTATLTHNNKHDWRLPTFTEASDNQWWITQEHRSLGWMNRDSRANNPTTLHYRAIPVRTL